MHQEQDAKLQLLSKAETPAKEKKISERPGFCSVFGCFLAGNFLSVLTWCLVMLRFGRVFDVFFYCAFG